MILELVKEYLQSLSVLKEASDTIYKYFCSVKKMHNALSLWQSLRVVPNLNAGNGDWPRLDTMKEALSIWIGANKEANDKWKKLPADDRKGLKSPDELKGQICI